jgi:hypothetical protein
VIIEPYRPEEVIWWRVAGVLVGCLTSGGPPRSLERRFERDPITSGSATRGLGAVLAGIAAETKRGDAMEISRNGRSVYIRMGVSGCMNPRTDGGRLAVETTEAVGGL